MESILHYNSKKGIISIPMECIGAFCVEQSKLSFKATVGPQQLIYAAERVYELVLKNDGLKCGVKATFNNVEIYFDMFSHEGSMVVEFYAGWNYIIEKETTKENAGIKITQKTPLPVNGYPILCDEVIKK